MEQGVEDGRGFDAGSYPPIAPVRIPAQAYKSVTLTPLAGLLQCGKYLPLRLMNSMVLEFSLARTDDALGPAGGQHVAGLRALAVRAAVQHRLFGFCPRSGL